jgi:hypothetical protein
MESQNRKKSNAKKITFFHSYDVMLDRFVPKICTSHHIKKCEYIQKIIEMIFNIYEIYSMY